MGPRRVYRDVSSWHRAACLIHSSACAHRQPNRPPRRVGLGIARPRRPTACRGHMTSGCRRSRVSTVRRCDDRILLGIFVADRPVSTPPGDLAAVAGLVFVRRCASLVAGPSRKRDDSPSRGLRFRVSSAPSTVPSGGRYGDLFAFDDDVGSPANQPSVRKK